MTWMARLVSVCYPTLRIFLRCSAEGLRRYGKIRVITEGNRWRGRMEEEKGRGKRKVFRNSGNQRQYVRRRQREGKQLPGSCRYTHGLHDKDLQDALHLMTNRGVWKACIE